MQDLASCVLRICDTSGNTHGTGFLVSESLAVTCAHVVNLCCAKPGDCVGIVFHANGQEHEAEVMLDYWHPADTDDVAFLRLLSEGEPLPAGVTPAVLGMTRACNGHAMRALGFPPLEDGYDVAWAEGKLRGVVPHPRKQPMLQMDASPIYEGMSGAPILDLDTGRVVGMVNEYLRDRPLEWATTTETLKAICPELQLHPPQAVEDYLAALGEYCANLPYLTLHDIRPPKTLNEVYIPLKAHPQPRKKDPQGLGDLEGLTRHEPLSIAEMMQEREQPHVLILGEPGAGKSTLLRQLAERAWDAPEKIGLDALHLPLLVPLRRLATVAGSLEERFNRALTAELMLMQELPHGFFTDWPAQTGAHWLILLDALDEVPADERARLLQWLKGMLNTVGQNRIILTSRPSGYAPGDLDDRLFIHYDLLSFAPDQTSEFARRWFEDKAEQFLKELERIRAGALSGTPLLLTIAAKVYLEKGALPERRSGLYGQFVDIWLAEAEQHGLRAELGERMCNVARFALAKLALAMTEQPGRASQAMLEQVAAAYLRDALHLSGDEARVNGRKFVQVMARRSGVFMRRGDDYDFIHPTFREYLAAWTIVRQCEHESEEVWQHLVSRWQNDWRGVALFALDLLSEAGQDVTPLLKRIWQESIEDGIYDYDFSKWGKLDQVTLILLELAQDEGIRYFADLDTLEDQAFWVLRTLENSFWETESVTPVLLTLVRDVLVDAETRTLAAMVLERLGQGSEAIPVLQSQVQDGGLNVEARKQALEILARLAEDETVEACRGLVCDTSVDPDLRAAATGMLSDIGYEEVD